MVLTLLILSAACHASWNIIAKSAKDTLTFLWCQTAFASVALALIVPWLCPSPDPKGYIFLAVSGLMQTAYYDLLPKTYSIGEISVVYPLTRGSAPVFICIFSALLGFENITLPVFLSVLLIFAGIYIVNMNSLSAKEFTAPIRALINVPQTRLALLNGLTVAAYTISDNQSVNYTDPLMIHWIIAVIPSILMLPMITKRGCIKTEIKTNAPKIIIVSVLTFLAYFLVLVAMKYSEASYTSSVREMSVVLVAIYSAVKLKEKFPATKIIGAAAIFCGIVLLSLFRSVF